MRIILAEPPNFGDILRVFDVKDKPVIFAFGSIIYNPASIEIPPSLMAHEAVHGKRQTAAGPTVWWRRYLDDPEFRAREELPAHQAEFKAFCARNTNGGARQHALWQMAARLSGPLYGRMIKYSEAKRLIAQ